MIKNGLEGGQVTARFNIERQSLAMMDHSGIAKVFDAGTIKTGQPYFVMELVQGLPITKYCDKNKISIEDRLKLFVDVCKAVQHAHQKGIVHRDLKPSNILVSNNEGNATPKIIDFGLAKALQHNLRLSDQSVNTEFGQVVGTVQYMSPEQAAMNPFDVDTRSDVYSLGVILYELLTGSTPIESETIRQKSIHKILETIRDLDPPKPSVRLESSAKHSATAISALRRIEPERLSRTLKGELDWIVMKSLDKDRNRRYETTNGFAEDVQRFLRGEVIAAKPPSVSYRIKKFATRNRGLVASLSTIGLLLVLGIFASSWFAWQSYRSELKAKAEEQRATSEGKIAIEERNRAIQAERDAIAAQERTEATLASSSLNLASSRFEQSRADEAIKLLDSIPEKYRKIEWQIARHFYDASDMILTGHTGSVNGVCYDPTGAKLASCSDDGTIRIWDSGDSRVTVSLANTVVAASACGSNQASAIGVIL